MKGGSTRSSSWPFRKSAEGFLGRWTKGPKSIRRSEPDWREGLLEGQIACDSAQDFFEQSDSSCERSEDGASPSLEGGAKASCGNLKA